MPYHDDFPDDRHPRADAIPLTQDNVALKDQLLAGIERAINGDYSFTVEVEQPDWKPGFMETPRPKYLARIAFLKLDGLSAIEEEDDDFDFEPEPQQTNQPPIFQLALEVKAHLLDKDKAAALSEEDAKKVKLAWPDGLRITLVDPSDKNISTWSSCYQPMMGMGEFSVNGQKSGFVTTASPKDKPIDMAYGINYGLSSGAGITENGMDAMDEFRIINQMLQNGKVDVQTADRFAKAVEASHVITLLNRDIDVLRGSLPYFERVIKESLATRSFRDMIAWKQYWEPRNKSRLY